jgi:hypothetical protein
VAGSCKYNNKLSVSIERKTLETRQLTNSQSAQCLLSCCKLQEKNRESQIGLCLSEGQVRGLESVWKE